MWGEPGGGEYVTGMSPAAVAIIRRRSIASGEGALPANVRSKNMTSRRMLLSRDHQLVTWDMRGHGQSDSPEDAIAYSEATTIADMAGILDEAGAERAIVGGLSLGGYMSLAFHLAHPERVRALMLFDTGPGYKKDAPSRGRSPAGARQTSTRRSGCCDTTSSRAASRSRV